MQTGDNTGALSVSARPLPDDRSHPGLMRRGETCPRCGLGTLDYNGLLDLECPVCAYTEGPGGGCT